MTPGRYLHLRRVAAGLSIDDVAARIGTEPPVAGQSRVELVRAIEADQQPLTADVMDALRPVFVFDAIILVALCAVAAGRQIDLPAICRECGCSEWDACRLEGGRTCSWSTPDLCSACVRAAA